jgi:hypothetical protein
MLRIPKGRAPWLTARYLFFINLLASLGRELEGIKRG